MIKKLFTYLFVVLSMLMVVSCDKDDVAESGYEQFALNYSIDDQHLNFKQSIMVNHDGYLSFFQLKEGKEVVKKQVRLSIEDTEVLRRLVNEARPIELNGEEVTLSDSKLNSVRRFTIESNLGSSEIRFIRAEEMPFDFTLLLGELSNYVKKYGKKE
ncbi:hypothetical protein EMN47_18575 [Prolixibacteraceae bacterium JC049]|nr:hypothetical protein [Prolixibacteraceae bacterium JC049]